MDTVWLRLRTVDFDVGAGLFEKLRELWRLGEELRDFLLV